MADDKNMFGGGNANSLYTPMSPDEQEVLARIVESRAYDLILHGWGIVHSPKVTFGDLRVQVPVDITFNRPVPPDPPVPVRFLDMELRHHSGITLFRKAESAVYGGKPLLISAGTHLMFIWDIAVKHMNPKLVRMFKPGATGLTSRWQDKDTGDMTLFGNNRLSADKRDHLIRLRMGEAQVRANDVRKLEKK